MIVLTLTSCETIKQKTGGINKIGKECPPKGERTLTDIFCREAK